MTETSFNLQPTLMGELLALRPLRDSDFDALFQVASDPLIWDQHPFPRYEKKAFLEFFEGALNSGGLLILDRQTQHTIGASRYYNQKAGEINIGYTFLSRSHWGGRFNRDLKKVMVGYALRFVNTVFF